MSVRQEALRARFHSHGPVILGGAAIFVLLVVEAARHHVVDKQDILYLVVLIPTIVLHEISHGIMAKWCGDDTASRAGRLSLNPLKHIDPIGTVLLPILLIVVPPHIAFGWAKPVPVRVDRLRHPRNQSLLVGLVGPFTNILIALAAGFLFRFVANPNALGASLDSWPIGDELLFLFGYVNVIIATFNLIPIPPLDGSVVIERVLPESALPAFYRLRSGMIILVLFVVIWDQSLLQNLFDHALTIWGNIVF